MFEKLERPLPFSLCSFCLCKLVVVKKWPKPVWTEAVCLCGVAGRRPDEGRPGLEWLYWRGCEGFQRGDHRTGKDSRLGGYRPGADQEHRGSSGSSTSLSFI
ncbi:hypothetical protein MHYP_G00117280 [Metynnis hypsauchen]